MPRRSLTITWDEPQNRANARDMTGLEYFRAMATGKVPHSPMAALIGFSVTEVDEGRVVVECTPGEQHTNLMGIAHGGLASTLLDACMGSAIQTTLPAGMAATTIELKVNFVRAITPAAGRLKCIGQVIHPGRRIATSEGRIVDAQGTLYAHGTTTMMVFPLRKET